MKKPIKKQKICKTHKKGGCAVCAAGAAAILLGGKSKRKSLKKQKKIKGGGYRCGICTKYQRDTIPIVNLCGTQCGVSNPICQGCAKETCRSGATPRFRHESAKNPTCPFCRKDITAKCLEITGKKTIEELVDWSKVPDINQVYTPQVVLAAAQAAQLPPIHAAAQTAVVPPNIGVDGQGPLQMGDLDVPMLVEELEPNPLTLHLHEDDIDTLHTIIEHMRETITDGLSVSIMRDVLHHHITPANILTYLETHAPTGTESNFRYDAYGINRTWTQHRLNHQQGNQANIHNFIQELKLLSITIRNRLIAGGYSAVEINNIKEDMLTYIFSQTMIDHNNEQSHWLIQILPTLYPDDIVSQGQYWEIINVILLRTMQYIGTDISIITTNSFAPPNHGGKTKKSLKKRRKTHRKKNNKK